MSASTSLLHISVHDLPALNATLNTAATVLLISGYTSIRLKLVKAHIAFMVLALLVSVGFLASYLTFHFIAGHTTFNGKGFIKWIYYPMLISHVILAAAIVPLVLTTVFFAIRRQFDRHRRIARWTLPLWLYVSVTGVLVYMMCYIWFV